MKSFFAHNSGLIKNIFILALSGIIAKSFDFIFRAFYSRALGAEGMGLLSLGFSMHGIMITFATAGLGVAVSKTASQYSELQNFKAVISCMNTALFGVSVLSLVVMLLTFMFSPYMAENILGDTRVSISLCSLSPSILFMGISYCLKGYFYASRQVIPPASSELLEQAVKFISIKTLLHYMLPYGIEYGCAAIFAGISIGELSSTLYLSLFYLKSKSKLRQNNTAKPQIPAREIVGRLLGIAIPSMITSLLGSFLRMKEEVLIISALERGNMPHSSAVSVLGLLHGMAMPLLVMPLNLLGSVMSLLIPEISRAEVQSIKRLRSASARIYKTGIPIGVAVGILFFAFGNIITKRVYGSSVAAELVVNLAPLCPIMFADSLSCSILNGLGKQSRILVFSLLDFCLRFTLIYITIPSGQMKAFAIMVAISNIFTCALSFGSVAKYMRKPSLRYGFKLTKRTKYGMLNK